MLLHFRLSRRPREALRVTGIPSFKSVDRSASCLRSTTSSSLSSRVEAGTGFLVRAWWHGCRANEWFLLRSTTDQTLSRGDRSRIQELAGSAVAAVSRRGSVLMSRSRGRMLLPGRQAEGVTAIFAGAATRWFQVDGSAKAVLAFMLASTKEKNTRRCWNWSGIRGLV